jgi:hypothetical protein
MSILHKYYKEKIYYIIYKCVSISAAKNASIVIKN